MTALNISGGFSPVGRSCQGCEAEVLLLLIYVKLWVRAREGFQDLPVVYFCKTEKLTVGKVFCKKEHELATPGVVNKMPRARRIRSQPRDSNQKREQKAGTVNGLNCRLILGPCDLEVLRMPDASCIVCWLAASIFDPCRPGALLR